MHIVRGEAVAASLTCCEGLTGPMAAFVPSRDSEQFSSGYAI